MVCAGPYNCYPLPPSRDPQLSKVGGRGHRAGGKGGGLQGGRGQVGRGKGKGAIVSETLVVGERMRKAPTVQSGRAMPMGRRASPPCP